eukprot:655276-Amphidinium_carterae.1
MEMSAPVWRSIRGGNWLSIAHKSQLVFNLRCGLSVEVSTQKGNPLHRGSLAHLAIMPSTCIRICNAGGPAARETLLSFTNDMLIVPYTVQYLKEPRTVRG